MPPKIDPRRVEYLPLEDLTPDPKNPKNHAEETIHDSIGRFGILDLIVQDQRTGHIVSGHGRAKALKRMQSDGESAPEGITVDKDGSWLVPVVTGWASRTDSEAHAALIALNRTTELGGWVDDELIGLLDELGEIEDGYVGVGFDEDDLESLRSWVGHLEERGQGDGPAERDLDALEEEFGSMTEEDHKVAVVIKLSPDLAERLSDEIKAAPDLEELVEGWLR